MVRDDGFFWNPHRIGLLSWNRPLTLTEACTNAFPGEKNKMTSKPCVLAPCVCAVLLFGASAPADEPGDGSILSRTQLRLEWDDIDSASAYEIQLGIATVDPFSDPLVSTTTTDSRLLITDGLEFGFNYRWRYRPVLPDGSGLWSDTRSFAIKNVPLDFQLEVEVQQNGNSAEPGITIFNYCSAVVGYDTDGTLVLHTETPTRLSDCKVIDGGRLLYVGGGRAWILSLDGDILWASPDDDLLTVHHSASMMPSGNVLMVTNEYRDVTQDGATRSWRGDRIVEMDPATNEIVWSWSTFDHFDTDDYDVFQNNHWNDWTHVNDARYVESDNSIYISVRHLSRVTRIDYDTGDIVYNLGMDMPSGDVDAGDDLFSYQHFPTILENGNMLLFDNGNRRGGEPAGSGSKSFAVELALGDLPLEQAEIAWAWQTPIYCPSTGSAQRLANGNTLVTATHLTGVYEVDTSGTQVWSLSMVQTQNCPGLRPGYRAVRVPNLYLDNQSICASDLTGDRKVNVEDLLTVIAGWGELYSVSDLLGVIQDWGDCD